MTVCSFWHTIRANEHFLQCITRSKTLELINNSYRPSGKDYCFIYSPKLSFTLIWHLVNVHFRSCLSCSRTSCNHSLFSYPDFTQLSLYLLLDLISPVLLTKKVPKDPTNQCIQPDGLCFILMATKCLL